MPDSITPVGAMIQPPNPAAGLDSYSKILGIQQQRAQLTSAVAEASMNQRTAQERQNLAQIPWQSFSNPDGSMDEDGITKAALAAAPTTGAEFASNLLSMSKGSAAAKSAWAGLTKDYQQQFQSAVASWASDPNSTESDLAKQTQLIIDQAPADQKKLVSNVVDHANTVIGSPNPFTSQETDLSHKKQIAMQVARSGLSQESLSGPGGVGTPATGTVNTGAQVLPTAQSRVTGQLTTPPGGVQEQLPPGVSILTDGLGRQFRYDQQSGRVVPVGQGAGSPQGPPGGAPPQTGPSVQGGPSAPGAPPGAPPQRPGLQFAQPVPGQADVMANVESARKAGDQVPVNRAINQKILTLLPTATTGPGTAFPHQVAAAIGLPSGAGYQEIGAFLDRQAAMASQSMGLPETNAGLEASKNFTGNTQYDNKVIADKTKFADALQAGTGAYRAGLEKALGDPQNPNFGAVNQYRAKWAANFDPNIFAYENAVNTKDTAAQKQIESDEGRKGMAQLQQKRRTLMGLVNGQ